MEQAKIYVTHASNVASLQLEFIQPNTVNFNQVISVDAYLKRFIYANEDPLANFYRFFTDLLANKESFGLLANQCESIEFANNVFNFLTDCQQFNVDLSTLDDSNSLNQQLKSLLITMNANMYIPLRHPIRNDSSFNFCLFSYGNLTNAQILHNAGIDLIQYPKPDKLNVTESLNINESLMTICQHIISEDIDVNDVTIILAEKSYLNAAITVFNSFNIPVNATIDDRYSVLIHLVKTYITFLKNQTLVNFIDLLFAGFKCEFDQMGALVRYAPYFKESNSPYLNENSELFSSYDAQSFNACYSALVTCFAHACTTSFSNYEMIEHIFNYLVHDENEVNFAQHIGKIVTVIGDDINTNHGFDFFMYHLDKINSTTTSFPFDSVLITDMNHPVCYRKYSYIIGLNNNNYPGFKPMNGLFDETFVRNSNYPSINERLSLHNDNLQWIFYSGDNVTIALSQNSFDGKAVEYPIFIDKSLIIKNPAINQPAYLRMDTHLDNTSAIIAPHGRIKGSISSLESYQHCPFAYFLQRVYKLYPYQDLFGANTIGTIVHGIFSKLYKCSKENMNDIEAIINTTLDTYLSDLIPLYSGKDNELKSIKKRLFDTCLSVWQSLSANPDFNHQSESEYELYGSIGNFDLKAIIDRIEDVDGYFSIIDYKSSEHTLSLNAICQGIQLQLLTYAYILDQHAISQPKDLIYINFFAKTTSYSPYKLGSKGAECNDINEFNTPTYPIKGYINGKISNRKMDIDDLLALVDAIYEQLFIKMTTQPFKAEPDESACTYCYYHSICRFNGQAKENEKLVNLPEKKENTDDEME